ncbi:MAG: NADH-quinone oxidoreductase subunit NuoK [Acidobacteriota bacterium]
MNLSWMLALSAALFTVGVLGVLLRRNVIIILMAIEIMLNATNLALVSFARHLGSTDGQVLAFFVMTVAAVEAAVGLAIVLAVFRLRRSVDVDTLNRMKW